MIFLKFEHFFYNSKKKIKTIIHFIIILSNFIAMLYKVKKYSFKNGITTLPNMISRFFSASILE
jgi:Na+/proline symporter